MLQDKINLIKPYFRSLENYNEALIVRVQFPPKWAVFPSDDGRIKPATSDQKAYEYFYYGDSNNVSLDEIFDFIKETIEVNESLEEKAKLLVEKAKELQELFEVTPLDKLRTLTFSMEEPKKAKGKRKYVKKAKTSEKAKEVPLKGDTDSNDENKNNIVSTNDEVENNVDKKTVVEPKNVVDEIKVSTTTLNKLQKIKAKKINK